MLEVVSTVAAALATVLSAISVFILVRDKVLQRRLEKMKLIITPKKTVSNSKDEIFYLYLSFSNESALPISVLDLRIRESGNRGTTYTTLKNESGTLVVDPINVIETDCVHKTVKIDYNDLSAKVPFVIEPYGVFSGYFAFYERGQDSFIIRYKEIELFVTTSRKSYKIEMNLNSANLYDFSYQDDGSVFGRGVIGVSHQDTSIPDNY